MSDAIFRTTQEIESHDSEELSTEDLLMSLPIVSKPSVPSSVFDESTTSFLTETTADEDALALSSCSNRSSSSSRPQHRISRIPPVLPLDGSWSSHHNQNSNSGKDPLAIRPPSFSCSESDEDSWADEEEATTSSLTSLLHHIEEISDAGLPLSRSLHSNERSRKGSIDSSVKHVSFDAVQIREYPMILGDNPFCSPGGPSFSLGWEYIEHPLMDLEILEWTRLEQRLQEPRLIVWTPVQRHEMALSWGYSPLEIMQHVTAMDAERRQQQEDVSEDKNPFAARAKQLLSRLGQEGGKTELR